MHILVVEDEQRLARLPRRVLMEERQTVDPVHDGAGGLERKSSAIARRLSGRC